MFKLVKIFEKIYNKCENIQGSDIVYIINNDTRIYLYDCIRERWLYVFEDYNHLLKFLASDVAGNLDSSYMKPFKSRYLNEINMGNDVLVWDTVTYTKDGPIIRQHIENRTYMFIDANNRLVDPRCDYRNILEMSKSDEFANQKYNRFFRRYKENENNLPVYRQDPIPGTGVRKHGTIIRHPKSMSEKRYNSDPEMKDFIRPSRRLCHLPDPWDDERFRPCPKSWKDCTKRKHQWKETPIRDDSDGCCFLEWKTIVTKGKRRNGNWITIICHIFHNFCELR